MVEIADAYPARALDAGEEALSAMIGLAKRDPQIGLLPEGTADATSASLYLAVGVATFSVQPQGRTPIRGHDCMPIDRHARLAHRQTQGPMDTAAQYSAARHFSKIQRTGILAGWKGHQSPPDRRADAKGISQRGLPTAS